MISQIIENVIKDRVSTILSKKQIPLIEDFSLTDSISEIIEKLIILHIRTWMLEDLASTCSDDAELGSIKRKLDICFKQKRPAYIRAINKLIDDSIINNKTLFEDSVKIYKDTVK